MKHFFGYIRVSTAKQGEQGVSLQEQRDAIQRYADRHGLTIVRWFEERETAAKRGRPIFTQMLKLLRKGDAAGVVIHKIDRSARNLKDWADLGEMIDSGIEVLFANEGLDLNSRGGRLSADIQAVVAADYIRNLREETRKGFYGRIKQGVYPLPAPLGYLDRGKGNPKEPDPETAPLVKKAFELYATGRYNLHTLRDELHKLGLRNRRGSALSITGVSVLLNNPFYVGLIRLKRTHETFPGAHQPLITKTLFERVNAILTGKTNTRGWRHDFLFRRLLACKHCGYSAIGELQKGHVYYRCHTRDCPKTSLREESVHDTMLDVFQPLQFSDEEKAHLAQRLARLGTDREQQVEARRSALTLAMARLEERLTRLTDAYLDGVLPKEAFEERRARLLLEKQDLAQSLTKVEAETAAMPRRLAAILELAGSAYLSYKLAIPEQKRQLVTEITSNRIVSEKNLAITLHDPFQEIANRFQDSNGAPYRDIPRTWDRLLPRLIACLAATPDAPCPSRSSLDEGRGGLPSAA